MLLWPITFILPTSLFKKVFHATRLEVINALTLTSGCVPSYFNEAIIHPLLILGKFQNCLHVQNIIKSGGQPTTRSLNCSQHFR